MDVERWLVTPTDKKRLLAASVLSVSVSGSVLPWEKFIGTGVREIAWEIDTPVKYRGKHGSMSENNMIRSANIFPIYVIS